MGQWIGFIGVVAGIVLGLLASELSARLGFRREVSERQRQQRLDICLDIINAATMAGYAARECVVMTQYHLRQPGAVSRTQLNETIETFNTARDSLRLNAARMKALGPDELRHGAQDLHDEADALFKAAQPLTGVTAHPAESLAEVEATAASLSATVDAFAATVATSLET